MPFDGGQLDELLNGYLDGELPDADVVQVKKLLEEAPEVQDRLRSLEAMRSDLKLFAEHRRSAAPGLPKDFTARVVAAAQAARLGQVGQADVIRSAAPIATRRGRSWSTTRRIALAGLAIAASLAVIINLPYMQSSNNQIVLKHDSIAMDENPLEADQNGVESSTPNPFGAGAIEAESTIARSENAGDVGNEIGLNEADRNNVDESGQFINQWRDEWRRQLTFVMVVDMSLTAEAASNNYVSNVLAAHSIPKADPVLADDKLRDVLEGSRMLGQADKADAKDAFIYFVHADTEDVDKLVQMFIDDFANVPELRTDMAYDAPVNQLMKQIVESSEGRFSMNQSFAAQVSDEDSARPSPFEGISPQGKLVSSSGRGRQSSSGMGLGNTGADSKSTVLLLIRVPTK